MSSDEERMDVELALNKEDADVEVELEDLDDNDGEGVFKPEEDKLFTCYHVAISVVPLLAGSILGYANSYVGGYTQMHNIGSDCNMFKTQTSCETLPFNDCVWQGGQCKWAIGDCASMYKTGASVTASDGSVTLLDSLAQVRDACHADDRCIWYSPACSNLYKYTSLQSGIFAGSIVIGSIIGAFIAGRMLTHLGTKMVFVISGVIGVAASIECHVDAYTNTFWPMCVGRTFIGVSIGLTTVAGPMYVHQNVTNHLHARWICVLFQVFTVFSEVITSILSLGMGQSIKFDVESDQHIAGRLQGLFAGQTAVCLGLLLVGLFGRETRVKFSDEKQKGALNQNEYSMCQMLPRILISITMCFTFRLTGYNALLNFGAQVMGGLGISAFLGNFFMMIANFVGTLVSLGMQRVLPTRPLFIYGGLLVSLICIFLCGVPIYPGVAKDPDVGNKACIAGIVMYFFFYQATLGPVFYVILQEIFPPSFRPRGNSIAQPFQFFFNFVLNSFYTPFVEKISGGPESNLHKGQAICFIFFGGVGFVCFVIELLFLRPWTAEDAARIKGESQDASDSMEQNEPAAVPETTSHREISSSPRAGSLRKR